MLKNLLERCKEQLIHEPVILNAALSVILVLYEL
jgi:hypothetical protein